MIVSILYFIFLFIFLRYSKVFQLNNLSKSTMPIAFTIKGLMGLVFSFIYIYSMKNASEPSDAIRFLDESNQLYNVLFKSKSDFFALLTGIGDNARMIHEHMDKTFIWDAGNFTLINDSRNTIRINCLFRFISFGEDFVNILLMCFLSLIGIHQLYISIQPLSKLHPKILFYSFVLFPSLLFWSSSNLKEPLLILGIGLLTRSLLIKDSLIKRILIGGVASILLILFKPYILFCLLPGILFYLYNKIIFKNKLMYSVFTSLFLLIIGCLCFPNQRQRFTENISRKQFNVENVGKGGIHVDCKNGYYYFKPHQYKNLKIENNKVTLIHSSDAVFLSVNTEEIPIDVYLKPTGKKWSIHIIMPGTNSYIKTTSIDNSFQQLMLNIPEALINTYFRPFPFDNGSFLIYPAMIEVWGLTFFLILSLLYKRKLKSDSKNLIVSLLIFALTLMLLIGWTTPVTGAIVRFRFPIQLAFFIVGATLIDPEKLIKKK
jgi:hypothetical protein